MHTSEESKVCRKYAF